MQLYYTSVSPYARKVRTLANILNIENLELIRINPMTDEHFRSINPLGKVPALVDGDMVLQDSTLICEYLDDKSSAAGGKSVYRRNTPHFYTEQKSHALANGIMDAAVSTMMELRRKDAEHSGYWLERWHVAMIHALKSVQLDTLGDGDNPNMGTIATVCALGYLDFRLPPLNWRECNPQLRNWYEMIEIQPWVQATAPQE